MEDEKMYTTTELMEITGLTRAAVLKRARLLGFTKYCKYVLKRTSWGNYIKEYSFTESQVKAMGCDHDLRRENVEVVEKTREEKLVKQLGFDKGFIEQEVSKIKNPNNKFIVDALIREVRFAYIAGAEPREKQIAELTEQNTSLLTSVENLNKSVQELEAQIEKMKRCKICEHSGTYLPVCYSKEPCKNKDKFELRR